jgi:DNA-binding SARP family transcriptional activator
VFVHRFYEDWRSSMRFRLLGPVELIAEDGKAIALATGRERVLLSTLVLGANRSLSAARLIDALWGEIPGDGG